MTDNGAELTSIYITSGLESVTAETFFEAASAPFRYLLKLYQAAQEEHEMRGITVDASRTGTELNEIVVRDEPSAAKLGFHDLPVNLQLQIFSYLDARSLCNIATTSHYWQVLSEDQVLWQHLLQRDVHTWNTIGHQTFPATYMEVNSDLTAKQIYLRCCPKCRSLRKSRDSFKLLMFHNLQNLPRLFSGKKTPSIVMFGPGLESETKNLVRMLLWDPASPFEVKGMFPGQFDGVGSGVCLKLDDKELNLITLYASTRKEREASVQQPGRQRLNKLLVQVEAGEQDTDEDQPDLLELRHPVRELCKTVDAFIYVVNSSSEIPTVDKRDKELSTVMNENWTNSSKPLIVMSCTPTAATPTSSCVEVVEQLDLTRLNRPWQVHSVCVENLDGLLGGFKWLMAQISHS